MVRQEPLILRGIVRERILSLTAIVKRK